MRVDTNKITIVLEDYDIDCFWNVVSFALDLQAQREKEGKPCMTSSELEMAKKLEELTRARY